jgi:hypothetical protein
MYHTRQTPPLVVLLSGWAGSGKDTAAALLVDELAFERVAFADALKADVATRTGIPLAVFHSARKNEPLDAPNAAFPGARTPRDCLIAHATAMRADNPDIYAAIVAAHIGANGGRYVISDWRFPNECAALCRHLEGATILRVRIVRPGMLPMADSTEHELDDAAFDAVIQNGGSISELRDRIKTTVSAHLRHGYDLCGP